MYRILQQRGGGELSATRSEVTRLEAAVQAAEREARGGVMGKGGRKFRGVGAVGLGYVSEWVRLDLNEHFVQITINCDLKTMISNPWFIRDFIRDFCMNHVLVG